MTKYDHPSRLTPAQGKVLFFINVYHRDHGMYPSYREILEHFGWSGLNNVSEHIEQLVKKGWLKKPAKKSRAYIVLPPPVGDNFVLVSEREAAKLFGSKGTHVEKPDHPQEMDD